MNQEQTLLRRVKWLTWFFIIGLLISGATAIPLVPELNWLVNMTGADRLVDHPASTNAPPWAVWLVTVRNMLQDTSARYPVLFYGTDWLAFGHFAIAIAFVGALRDPVRNKWLYDFGMIACALIVPYAFVFGEVRGIPVWWRLIDCSFGVFGIIPVWLCRKWTAEVETLRNSRRDYD